MSQRKLYTFHSSSTSFRVRIALNLKKISHEAIPVALRWKGGENETDTFTKVSPQRNVPAFVDGDLTVNQSLAILDYLDRIAPEPSLFPVDAAGRARVLAIALAVACDIQPLNNLSVERYLANDLGLGPDATRAWRRHWIQTGLDAIERMLGASSMTSSYCHGDIPTAADCCVVPQAYNAMSPMVGLDLATWPTISRIYAHCMEHPAFIAALPKNQPDFAEIKEH